MAYLMELHLEAPLVVRRQAPLSKTLRAARLAVMMSLVIVSIVIVVDAAGLSLAPSPSLVAVQSPGLL